MSRPFLLAATIALSLVVASTARAQLNELNIKGKVVELGPNMIAVKVDVGDVTWLASIDPNRVEDGVRYTGIPEAKIEVTGVEGPDVLRAGMFVRFEADVEKKKVIKGTISELTIIGPGKDNAYGLLPSGGAGEGEGDGERMLVVGQLTAATRASITVGLPEGKTIKAKIAPDAVVKISSSDYTLARPGDEIEVKGFYGKAPRAFATSVVVKRAPKAEKGPRKPAVATKKPDPPGKKPSEPAAAPAFGEADPSEVKPADKPAVPTKPGRPGKILKVN